MSHNSKLRILFDARPLVSPKTGVGFYTENIIKSFAEAHPNGQLTGYYFDFLGKEKKQLPRIPGIRYKKIRWFPYKGLSFLRRFGLQVPLTLIIPSSLRYNIVFFPDFVSLRVFGSAKSCAVIHDVGFEDVPEYVSDVNGRFLRRFVPKTIATVDHVICDSEFTKSRIIKNYSTSDRKISVVYPGIEASDEIYKTRKEGPVVFVGTIEPRKNIANLIRAYALLPTKLQAKHPLVLAGGEGWKDEEIVRTIAELVAHGVPITNRGYITDAEKVVLYKSASTVVLVPHYEGFGMQILEAMQYNAPLLLGDIPVFREIAGTLAQYCDKDLVEDIAKKLENMLANPSFPDYKQAVTKFSNTHSAHSLYLVFNKLLGDE